MKKIIVAFLAFLAITQSAVAQDISAYLQGKYIDVAQAKEKLSGAGYKVIAEYTSVKDGITLVFTDDALKSEASKPKRAYAAVLRIFVDNKEKKISITNPVYFGRAYMQDDYNAKVFEAELANIKKTFSGLKGSKDMLDADDISGYHFMMGMPYYEDPDELAEGKTADLLKKVQSYKGGKNVVFTLKLNDDSYLIGYDLSADTKKFVEKIGRANASVLPYTISIEKDVATSLAAKYYLALCYPLLSMGGFTTIMDIPGAITEELTTPFK